MKVADVGAEIDGLAVGARAKRATKRFGLEMKFRDGRRHTTFLTQWNDWGTSWRWYLTAAQRDRALATLNRKDTLFQYRPIDR